VESRDFFVESSDSLIMMLFLLFLANCVSFKSFLGLIFGIDFWD
jgi:hypothetical protein